MFSEWYSVPCQCAWGIRGLLGKKDKLLPHQEANLRDIRENLLESLFDLSLGAWCSHFRTVLKASETGTLPTPSLQQAETLSIAEKAYFKRDRTFGQLGMGSVMLG